MAGSFSGFNANEFRTGIRFAMDMGAAVGANERIAFYFPNQLVYNAPTVGEQVPFDPTSTVTTTTPDPVRVPCGIEYTDSLGQPTNFGNIVPSRIAVTLLDEDYAQVEGCTYVVLGGEKYNYHHTQSPSGLFDVGVYVMHFVNENDL